MNANLDHLPADITRHRVLSAAEAAALCNISLPHFRRLYRENKVPAPIRFSARKLGWKAGVLIDWLDQQSTKAA